MCSSGDLFDAEVLDHLIGEELAAHLFERGVGRAVSNVHLDEAAGADIVDAFEAETFERMVNGAALRIEHPVLEADVDPDLHRATFMGGGPSGQLGGDSRAPMLRRGAKRKLAAS